MNFFRTSYTLCTKISALVFLTDIPLWRSILHTFLLLIICSVATASCSLMLESGKIDMAAEKIDQETGGFFVHENRLFTGRDIPERHFLCNLHSIPVRVDYFATEDGVKNAELNSWNEPMGLALTPTKIFLWNGDGGKRFSAGVLDPGILQMHDMDPETVKSMNTRAVNRMYETEGFRAALKDAVLAGKSVQKEEMKEAERFACKPGLLLKFMLWITVCFYTANQIFFLAVLALLIMPAIEMLRFRVLPNKLPYPKLMSLTLYTTFPAFIAASIFESFANHVVSFQTVFFIVFIIYQMLAFGKLILHLNPLPKKDPRSNDDDDFDDDDF